MVRNLIEGRRVAAEWGTEPLPVGWLYGSRSQIGQMPQILREFGFSWAVISDGLNALDPELPPKTPDPIRGYPPVLRWESRGGLSIYALFVPRRPQTVLYEWGGEEGLVLLRELMERLAKRSPLRRLLLLCGEFYRLPDGELLRLAELARRTVLPDGIRTADLKGALWSLEEEVAAQPEGDSRLPSAAGELRNRYTPGWGTGDGRLSARVGLKRVNWRCQRDLEHWAEPFSALAWFYGASDPRGMLRYLWRRLLENHTPPAIGGYAADPVHRQMRTRLAQVEHGVEELIQEALSHLAAQVQTRFGDAPEAPADDPSTVRLVVFNPLSVRRREAIEVEAIFDPSVQVNDVSVTDSYGNNVPAVCLEVERVTLSPELGRPRPRRAQRVRFLMMADVPAVGYAAYRVQALPEERQRGYPGGPFQNDSLIVKIGTDGRLTITNRQSGASFGGLHWIEDASEAGDAQEYRPAESDEIVHLGEAVEPPYPALEIRNVERNPLRMRYRITGRLPTSKGNVIVSSELTLVQGLPALQIGTSIDNARWNHRIRALFPTRIEAKRVTVGGQFEAVKRPIQPWSGWENPSYLQPCYGYVDVSDFRRGLTVAAAGLTEYEVLRDGQNTVALTLLRAVGQTDERWGIPTPDAQSPGRHHAEYAIIPHGKRLEESGAVAVAQRVLVPLRAVQTDAHAGRLPPRGSFLDLSPRRLVLSAFKLAEDRDSWIVRFYNPFRDEQTAELSFGLPVREVYRARMDETRLEPLSLTEEGKLILSVAGFQIVTLELVPGET
ncbi:MAG: hypothetical protein KatS3mg115_1752 [Candidatus Poribacteria bacterium]|nr:MAG: hypothetical protein KatS3mg115_1752 [Candidatus Poribacteria bacterium]